MDQIQIIPVAPYAFLYLDNFIAWFQKLYRLGCQYAMTDERTRRLNTAQHSLKIRGGTPAQEMI